MRRPYGNKPWFCLTVRILCMPLAAYYGLLRSLAIYYGHPLRHRRLLRLYRSFVRPGDLVFDVGAHVGNHSRAFAALGATVVALEPQPLFYRFLQRIFARQPAITVLPDALGAAAGAGALQVSARHPTVSSLSADWTAQAAIVPSFAGVAWDETITVPVRTLDSLITAYGEPAFCKLDVEGSELDVLNGLSRPLKALVFEYLPAGRETALGCLARLEELGDYVYNWSGGETAQLVHENWQPVEKAAEHLAGLPADAREGNLYARLLL